MQKVINDNYIGTLFPGNDKTKAMIVLTGSDGGHKWAQEIAKTFAIHGISAFAVSYWKDAKLPKVLSLIPVELVKSAAEWLKGQGYQKIGIYGISKGAELALTAASLSSEIEFVVAVSPSCCVFEGIAKPKYSGESSWKWQDKPMPFASFKNVKVNMIKSVIKNRELGFTSAYLEVLKTEMNESNTIKVENINGPILLIAAKEDAQWPSTAMCSMISERLKNKKFAFPFQCEIFDPASHILCPVKTAMRFAYRIERNCSSQCDAARKKALNKTLEFLSKL